MSPLRNPYPAGDQLHVDFDVVSAAQLSSARREAAQALLGRAGCLGDALIYYQGADPAHEVDNAYFDALTITEQQNETFGRVLTGLHAAEILVASVVHPGFYDRRDSRRVRMLSKEADWYKILSVNSHGMLTPYDTIGEALAEIKARPLTTADAATLSMSAEMLSSALTWWQIAKIKIYKSDKEGFANDYLLQDILNDSETALLASTITIQDTIKQKTIDEVLPDIEPGERLERAALGLKAQWRSDAIFMHPALRYAAPERVSKTLNGMISSLHKEFIEGDLLDTKKYPKKEIKGLLHELLWLVDAHMVMRANPDDYPTIHVDPSATRLDRPIIGRPAYLRGIDYAIADVDEDFGQPQLINLKSGHGDDRAYHPRIKPVKERNFLDINRGRLTNKLKQYRAIIESDFSLPTTHAIIDKYVLETVKEELALYKNPSPSEGWPYIAPSSRG